MESHSFAYALVVSYTWYTCTGVQLRGTIHYRPSRTKEAIYYCLGYCASSSHLRFLIMTHNYVVFDMAHLAMLVARDRYKNILDDAGKQ